MEDKDIRILSMDESEIRVYIGPPQSEAPENPSVPEPGEDPENPSEPGPGEDPENPSDPQPGNDPQTPDIISPNTGYDGSRNMLWFSLLSSAALMVLL